MNKYDIKEAIEKGVWKTVRVVDVVVYRTEENVLPAVVQAAMGIVQETKKKVRQVLR